MQNKDDFNDSFKTDGFTKKVTDVLNRQAQQIDTRPLQRQVVLEIQSRKQHARHNRIGMGLALAAAISGISVLPQLISSHQPTPSAATAKISPQLADDLDMLMVLGEDAVHGS